MTALPPYEVLDDILRGLVDLEEGCRRHPERGHYAAAGAAHRALLYIAEYKRPAQAPRA